MHFLCALVYFGIKEWSKTVHGQCLHDDESNKKGKDERMLEKKLLHNTAIYQSELLRQGFKFVLKSLFFKRISSFEKGRCFLQHFCWAALLIKHHYFARFFLELDKNIQWKTTIYCQKFRRWIFFSLSVI